MSILKAACIGIAGTFLALQFQNTRKEYGIYLGIAVSIFLFLGMSRNLSVIRETLELVGSFVKIDAVYLTAMLKILEMCIRDRCQYRPCKTGTDRI